LITKHGELLISEYKNANVYKFSTLKRYFIREIVGATWGLYVINVKPDEYPESDFDAENYPHELYDFECHLQN